MLLLQQGKAVGVESIEADRSVTEFAGAVGAWIVAVHEAVVMVVEGLTGIGGVEGAVLWWQVLWHGWVGIKLLIEPLSELALVFLLAPCAKHGPEFLQPLHVLRILGWIKGCCCCLAHLSFLRIQKTRTCFFLPLRNECSVVFESPINNQILKLKNITRI